MPIPYDQLPIGEGLDPAGNAGASFFVDRAVLEILEQHGPEWKYDDARFNYEAVQRPDAIFETVPRADEAVSNCWSVRPTTDPDDESSLTPPRFGYVFLVFARPGVGGFVVFDWDWREESPDEPGHPIGWHEDFGRRTWPTT